MKVNPQADYPVRVYEEPSQHDPPEAEFYTGLYAAQLNYWVDVVFIPDVSAVAPPWDDHLLPPKSMNVATPEQARLAIAISRRYVVTPNDDHAGTDERYEWDPHDEYSVKYGPLRGVVFYVSQAEFDRYAAELARLAEMNMWSTIPQHTVSELRDFEVIGFIERRVVASRWLRPDDAALLDVAPTEGSAVPLSE